MQMFDNFEHLPPNYIPNNMFPPIPYVMTEVDNKTVHKVFKDGKHVGYWWNWGDVVQIPIKNSITIHLEAGARVVYDYEEPDENTPGDFIGQKIYNLTQLRSWTLTSILDPYDVHMEYYYSYVWVEDEKFLYPENGEQEVTINMDLCCCKRIVAQLFNFRKERIKDWVIHEPNYVLEISPEESLKLMPGIYYLNVHLEDRITDECDIDKDGDTEEEVSPYLKLTNAYEIQVRGF